MKKEMIFNLNFMAMIVINIFVMIPVYLILPFVLEHFGVISYTALSIIVWLAVCLSICNGIAWLIYKVFKKTIYPYNILIENIRKTLRGE